MTWVAAFGDRAAYASGMHRSLHRPRFGGLAAFLIGILGVALAGSYFAGHGLPANQILALTLFSASLIGLLGFGLFVAIQDNLRNHDHDH